MYSSFFYYYGYFARFFAGFFYGAENLPTVLSGIRLLTRINARRLCSADRASSFFYAGQSG